MQSVVEQGVARGARLLESHEAEIVAPAFEQREAHRLIRESAREERQVLADELFLQVDRVRRHDRALTVRGRPAKRRHEIAERFADTRAGFEQSDAAFVVEPRDLDGHRALARTVLVARVLLRNCAAGAEVTVDAREVDRPMRAALRHFDDDVQLRRSVVDDGEPDAVVVQPRRDVEVGLRRVEVARRMIVDEHLALLGEPGQREDAANVAARHESHRLNDAVLVDRRDETHFTPAGQPDRRADGERCLRAQACRRFGRDRWSGRHVAKSNGAYGGKRRVTS